MENLDDSVFQTLHDQFSKLKTLQKNDKIGIETEPPWNANEAKNLLDTIMSNVDNLMECVQKDCEIFYRLLGMKYALNYEKATLLINTENVAQALELMSKTLDAMNVNVLKPEIIFVTLKIVNHYSCLLIKQGDLHKPQTMLEESDQMYRKLKSQGVNLHFYSEDDLFSPQLSISPRKESAAKAEGIVTNNMLMLSSIYHKLGNHEKSATYNHHVLNRQLETREFEATAWASKAAQLASYFITKSRFREARHHLAAACHILEECEKELKNFEPSKTNISKWEEIQRKLTDIAKFWVKYGLILFGVSKTRLVSLFYEEPNSFLENLWLSPFDEMSSVILSECNNSNETRPCKLPVNNKPASDSATGCTMQDNDYIPTKLDSKNEPDFMDSSSVQTSTSQTPEKDSLHILFAKPESKDPVSAEINKDISDAVGKEGQHKEEESNMLLFESLDLANAENQVAAELIETTEQARALFLYTHSWLKKSKTFYTLREHPMEYVNAILDLSELYKYLAFYEEDVESQYSVQKRRADALETLSVVLKEVRPQCYVAVNIELLRELAEVQLEMMGLNLRRLYTAHETATMPQSDATGNNLTLHKMEALADIHSKLEEFGNNLGHGTEFGDGVYEMSTKPTGDTFPCFL